jgi:plastocyanin
MRLTNILLLTAVALSVALPATPKTEPQSQQAKQTYQRSGNEGVVIGTVLFSGRPPGRKLIEMSADSVCAKRNPRAFLDDMVVTRRHLANVLVYIKGGPALDELRFDTPSTPVVLDQQGCRFVPHVSGIQVNQTLEVRNSDPTTHNVHATPKLNPDWNQSQPAGGAPLIMKFGHSELIVPIKCNQHPWMKAYVGVLSHPFFAVSDRKGAFRIEGLPPGNYTIAAWHEMFGEKTLDVTIAPRSQQNLNFSFSSKDQRAWNYSPR